MDERTDSLTETIVFLYLKLVQCDGKQITVNNIAQRLPRLPAIECMKTQVYNLGWKALATLSGEQRTFIFSQYTSYILWNISSVTLCPLNRPWNILENEASVATYVRNFVYRRTELMIIPNWHYRPAKQFIRLSGCRAAQNEITEVLKLE